MTQWWIQELCVGGVRGYNIEITGEGAGTLKLGTTGEGERPVQVTPPLKCGQIFLSLATSRVGMI